MVEAKTRMTAAELEQLPNDGWRYELRKGELLRMPPAGEPHGRHGNKLNIFLGHYVLENRLGVVYSREAGFQLESDPDTVYAPDIAFLRRDRVPTEDRPGFFPGAPDLAVEVVSPSDTAEEDRKSVV